RDSPAGADVAGRDERLARVLEELSRRKQRGEAPDLDALARQHPDLIDEIRQLLAVAQFADALGRAEANTSPYGQAPPAGSAATLPRAFGDYELLEELRRGGLGLVYKAWEKPL